ncbi:hypothetical protein SCARD494_05708 [Seiridium cardinale]
MTTTTTSPPITSPTPTYTTIPEPSFSVIYPNGNGDIHDHTDVDYTHLAKCHDHGMDHIDSDMTYNTNEDIGDGAGTVVDNDLEDGVYCTIVLLGTYSIGLAIADTTIGATYFSGQQLQDFLRRGKTACGDDPAAAIGTASEDPDDAGGGYFESFCLVHPGLERACGTN